MFFILLIIGLIIAIIVLTVRYLYIQAHILSSREFRKAAERQSFRAKAKNPEITCDYCGYVINTAKDKRCPNCGAVYGNDKELKNRFDVNEAAAFQAAISTVFALAAYRPALLGARIIDNFDIKRVYIASVPVWGIFLAFNLLISPRKYETLHVNLMQVAYWGTLFLLFILLCLLCVLFYYVVTDMIKKSEMEERARIYEMQESSYQVQQRYIEENARIRHDFRHVIATLNELSQTGDIDSLRKMINEYMSSMPNRETERFCNNMAVNAVLNNYMQRAAVCDIRIDWNIDLSDDVKVSDIDICSIIGNILENAIIACEEVPADKRFIELELRTEPAPR